MGGFLEVIEIILKLIIGFGILNVWLLRRGTSSKWRGGNAGNMKEEFQAYGLPMVAMYIVGFLKCTFALMLIISIFWSGYVALETIAAYGIAVLMAGAITMHARIGDSAKKSLPAFIMMVLSILVVLI
ncbi:MAG: DoxX family protein [Nonlabens sp.]